MKSKLPSDEVFRLKVADMLIEPILRFCLESMLIWPATKRTVWQRDFQFEKALRAWNQIISLLPLSRSHQPSLYIKTPMTPILKPTTPLLGRRPPSVRTRGRQRRTRTRSVSRVAEFKTDSSAQRPHEQWAVSHILLPLPSLFHLARVAGN